MRLSTTREVNRDREKVVTKLMDRTHRAEQRIKDLEQAEDEKFKGNER